MTTYLGCIEPVSSSRSAVDRNCNGIQCVISFQMCKKPIRIIKDGFGYFDFSLLPNVLLNTIVYFDTYGTAICYFCTFISLYAFYNSPRF